MAVTGGELEMVQRHVDEGRLLIERQQRVIADLTIAGRPTKMAIDVLATLEHAQNLHEEHLARVRGRMGHSLRHHHNWYEHGCDGSTGAARTAETSLV